MRFKIGFGLALMALVSGAFADEQWVGFSTDRPFAEARIEIGQTGAETVEFDLVVPGVSLERVATETGNFTRLEVPGLGRVGGTGAPMLPALRRFVEIPLGATAKVTATVLDRATVDLAAETMPSLVYPVQLPMPKCDCPEADNWKFSFDPKAYQGRISHAVPRLAGPFGLRDHRMMLVTASPVTYDPAAGTIEIATRMRVTVTISGGDLAATTRAKERLSSRHYDAFLSTGAVNLNLTEAGGWAYPDSAPVEFLIITPPQFVADLEPFVEWKTSTGYDVSVVTTDVAGTTTTAIKSFITGLYNGPNPPVYILMIGDSPSPLPTYTPSGGGTGGTDLPYVQMDGDLYPDLMIARWPIDDSTELANMRDKILHYERPTAANSAWLNRALFLAGDDYIPNGVTTHEDVVAELMAPPPNSAECEVWFGDTQNPTTAELIADLNTGRAWAVYSAHCGQSGMSGDPPFHSGDVPNLANADQYPLGLGHCCLSNQWATNADVFGEVTVIQPDKGFVSYWGGSNSTYWDEDDWLEKGFFDALFDADMNGNIGDWDGLYSNIAACYAGLSEVTLRGGNETYYWPMYNLNGDPTLDPFTRATHLDDGRCAAGGSARRGHLHRHRERWCGGCRCSGDGRRHPERDAARRRAHRCHRHRGLPHRCTVGGRGSAGPGHGPQPPAHRCDDHGGRGFRRRGGARWNDLPLRFHCDDRCLRRRPRRRTTVQRDPVGGAIRRLGAGSGLGPGNARGGAVPRYGAARDQPGGGARRSAHRDLQRREHRLRVGRGQDRHRRARLRGARDQRSRRLRDRRRARRWFVGTPTNRAIPGRRSTPAA